MAINATTNIKKGEEINLFYTGGLEEYSVRQKALKCRKFVCQCPRCETDANDELCSKRDKMVNDFLDFDKQNKQNPRQVLVVGKPFLKKVCLINFC